VRRGRKRCGRESASTVKATALGAAVLIVGAFACAGCSKQESAPTASPSPSASAAPLPVRNDVSFAFNDVSVTTSGPTLLRLGFTAHNISKDPVQCDASEFSVQLSDGSVVQADQSAENKCDPDSMDPGATSKGTIFFDLKSGYTGPVTLLMTANGAVVGKGSTTIH
jgi:hypothetical protein